MGGFGFLMYSRLSAFICGHVLLQPRMHANERKLMNELIERVGGAIYEVGNTMGAGFVEKICERALVIKLHWRSYVLIRG